MSHERTSGCGYSFASSAILARQSRRAVTNETADATSSAALTTISVNAIGRCRKISQRRPT